MIAELINHLWQSTLFAVMAWLLTIAFSKNLAHVRYWLWLSASFKFLVPFSLLMSLGGILPWGPAAKITTPIPTPGIALKVLQVSQQFPGTSPSTSFARSSFCAR